MAISGTDSLFAIAKQSARDVEGVGAIYVDAITPEFAVNENVKVRRPHIGQSPFERGAYKVGVGAPVSSVFEATPNILGTVLNLATGKAESGDWYHLKLNGVTSGSLVIWDSTNAATIDCTAADMVSELKTKLEAAAFVNVGSNPTRRVIVSKVDSTSFNIGFINQASLVLVEKTGDPANTHDGTVTLTDVSGGAHLIRFDPANKYALPWFTAWRSVGSVLKEKALNGKVSGMDMIFAGGESLLTTVAGAALNPRKVSGSMPTQSYDSLPIFTVMDGAHVTLNVNGSLFGTREASAMDVLAARLRLTNDLTRIDERYRIGSKYPAGLDALRRGAGLEVTSEFSDASLYEALIYDGDEWNPSVITGNVSVAATTSVSSGIPHMVETHARNVLFSAQSLDVQPRQLVRAVLTATALSTDATTSEVEFYLFNEQTSI